MGKRFRPPLLDLGVLLLASLVALALRLYRLPDSNVWWDEGYGVYLARKDLLTLALETAGDVHPPIHYWFLHVWIRLVGETELAIRYSSVAFAVASVPLIYWLGRRTLGRGVGLVAALLLATSRFHVEWSQQIRMYTLVVALAMLSIALTLDLWERPRRRLWVAHVAVTVFGLYTLYLSGLVPLVESLATVLLWLLPVGGRRLELGFVLRWAGAQAIALALFVPWALLFKSLPRATPAVLFPIDLQTFLHASATAFPLGISAYVQRYTPITLAALALATLGGLAVARPARRRLGVLLYALLLVPPGVVYALSFPNPVLYAPNLSVRYLLIFIPAYHLLVAAAVCLLWRGFPRSPRASPWSALPRAAAFAATSAFLAAIAAWSLADYYPQRRLVDDYQTVARYLKAYARPGDAVVLNSDRDWPIFAYHYDGGLERYGVGSLEPITPRGADELLAPILTKHGSLWLLTSDNAYDSDPAGHVVAWLQAHARTVGEVAGPRRKLTLYSTDPARAVSTPAAVLPRRALDVTFEGGLAALGYDLATAEVEPGEDLRLALYWRAPGPLPADAHAALRLVGRDGLIYRDVRAPLRPAYSPNLWQAGQIVRADYQVPIPKAMPGGSYGLALAVASGGRELPAVWSSGTTAPLRTIRVRGPEGMASPRPAPQRALGVTLGDRVQLLGYDLAVQPDRGLSAGVPARGEITPGAALRLRLYWESLQAVDRPYTVFVQLIGQQANPATGNPVWAQQDSQPVRGQRPTDSWVPGEVIADEYELVVPSAPAGQYQLHVGLYHQPTGKRLAVLEGGRQSGDSLILLEGVLR